MSTTTVSVRSTTRDANLAAVRRREAEAREAARQARRRAEEERRKKEAMRRRAEEERRREEQRRRRIANANQAIADQEARYQRLVERLDEAARRLPDLTLAAPRLASLGGNAAEDPAKLEAYAAQMAADVVAFCHRVDSAIAEAEHLLKRRIAKAAAWRRATDLEQRIELLIGQIRESAAELGTEPATILAPARPCPEADLEEVETYEAALMRRLDEAQKQRDRLRAQIRSRESAIALSGTQVKTRSAEEALCRHAQEQSARATAALRAHQDAELARAGLSLRDLPEALQSQLGEVLRQAPRHDYRESVTRWIARERQRRWGIARALELMQCAPDLVHADPGLSQRWASLAEHLQRIAGGLEDFNPSIEREYEQLRADAGRLVNAAFTRADWVQAMCEQGFEVLERQDGQGLVVIDLDHPEIWLEATEYENEQGGFGATLELKTDASTLGEEAGITDSICAKLARAAGSGTPEVATEAAVIEHDRRIKRARRPAVAQKTFAQHL